MIDLHIHTTHSSDGQYRPDEIFAMTASAGLKALSFTDHMDKGAAVHGVNLASRYPVEFFTGVEISTSLRQKEYHLLCYGFDPDSTVLDEFLSYHCSRIWEHADKFLDHFQAMGFDVTKDDISGWGKSVPTGVTFLDAIKKRNSNDPRLHAYLKGEKAHSPYLNFYKDFSLTDFGSIITSVLPSLTQSIHALKGSGVLILAHPGDIDRDLLKVLKQDGLDGIEVYSSHHEQKTTRHLKSLAADLDLFASAGSDFHGERIKPDIPFGYIPGQPDERLMQVLRRRRDS